MMRLDGMKRRPTKKSTPWRRYWPKLEQFEGRLAPAIFTVFNTDDGGPGSLRSAMIDAENTPNVGGPDRIEFNIPGSGVHIIQPTTPSGEISALPVIHDPVIIDGYTQPGASPNTLAVGDNAVLKIEINGSLISAGGPRLFVFGGSGSGSTVRGLAITHVPYASFQMSEFGADAADNNTIVGNFIGTDAGGSTYQGGGPAIYIVRGSGNHIGGPDPADRNVIAPDSFVTTASITMQVGTGNVVQGNYIGVNKDGTGPLQSPGGGFAIDNAPDATSGHNTIAGNVIFATLTGIRLTEGSGGNNVIQGNFIGTNATGTAGLGSGQYGIDVQSSNSTIAGNVISGFSTGIFVHLQSTPGPGPTIQGNMIGTDVSGTSAIPNDDGINVSNAVGATDSARIGGTNLGEGNTIAFNNRYGVFVNSGQGVSILGNSIFANGNLGINLVGPLDGFTGPVTPNDASDSDTGPNGVQNYPVITSAITLGAKTMVAGTFNSTSSTQFRLEFFASDVADPSGFGEGQKFLGFTNVTTDAAGNASFHVAFATAGGNVISATATDPAGNTSEFSQSKAAVTVHPVTPIPFIRPIPPAPGSGPGALTVCRTRDLVVSSPRNIGNVSRLGNTTIRILKAVPTETESEPSALEEGFGSKLCPWTYDE